MQGGVAGWVVLCNVDSRDMPANLADTKWTGPTRRYTDRQRGISISISIKVMYVWGGCSAHCPANINVLYRVVLVLAAHLSHAVCVQLLSHHPYCINPDHTHCLLGISITHCHSYWLLDFRYAVIIVLHYCAICFALEAYCWHFYFK